MPLVFGSPEAQKILKANRELEEWEKERDEDDNDEEIECPNCDGFGDCADCEGVGCEECEDTGDCPHCWGEGYIEFR